MKDFVKICLSNSDSATCNIGWTRLQHSKQHCSECILLIAVCKQLPVVLVTMLTCDNYNWRPSQKELVYWAIVLIPGFKREVYTISCSELQQCGYVEKRWDYRIRRRLAAEDCKHTSRKLPTNHAGVGPGMLRSFHLLCAL